MPQPPADTEATQVGRSLLQNRTLPLSATSDQRLANSGLRQTWRLSATLTWLS
jgi:hypothetical protein